MQAEVCRYHFNDGIRTCVAFKGHKFVRLVVVNPDVAIKKIPIAEYRNCKPLDYPLRKAIDSLLSVGERNGITQGAIKLLQSVEHQSQPKEEISTMELAIEKTEQPVVSKSSEDVKRDEVELGVGLSAKRLEEMLDEGFVGKQAVIAYLQERVDTRTAQGKTCRKPTLKLLAKLKAE